MIQPQDRRMALEFITEAVGAGAGQEKACKVLGLNERTVRRWRRQLGTGNGLKDRRGERSEACVQANRLTEKEKARIIQVCNQEENRSLAPSQIVPKLADEGVYIASESSLYRVLRKAGQLQRRGRTKVPRAIIKPKGYKAQAPNQVWSWDITSICNQMIQAIFKNPTFLVPAMPDWELGRDFKALSRHRCPGRFVDNPCNPCRTRTRIDLRP